MRCGSQRCTVLGQRREDVTNYYKAYTLDRSRYPDDPRLQNLGHGTASAFVRRINGKRFLYLIGQWPDMVSIYRFDGEIAVPSGILAKKYLGWPANQPTNARWMWRDRGGVGLYSKQ